MFPEQTALRKRFLYGSCRIIFRAVGKYTAALYIVMFQIRYRIGTEKGSADSSFRILL